MNYIPADKLKAEIERRRKQKIEANDKIAKGETYTEPEDDFNRALARYGNTMVYQELFEIICFIEFLQQEQPEHGHFVSYYISGKKPIFNVGDILAYYVCTSNEEGERNIGKIEKVVFDEEEDGWVYTFENGDAYSEEELVSDDFYKKN